jgi:hypothetical protein
MPSYSIETETAFCAGLSYQFILLLRDESLVYTRHRAAAIIPSDRKHPEAQYHLRPD